MQYGIIFLTLILSMTIKLVGSMTFNGKTPPNSYIIPVGVGDVIVATASWTSTATDLDLHLFQPGRIISDSNSDDCECDCCGSTQTATVTANANGNVIAWAQQWGGAGVQYTITITRNGVVVAGQTTFLSQNASFFKQSVTTVPCTMFINFTSAGSFDLKFYSPGTLLTAGPIKTMSYAGNSGWVDVAVPLTAAGTYDLKVSGIPLSPPSGWSSIIYYSGSMICKACSDFMPGCQTCTSSKVCTLCGTGWNLAGGKCLCSVSNCDTCLTATTCSSCDSGYYVNAGLCPSCSVIPGCETCTSGTFCTLCSGANFFNATSGQCRPCNQAMPGCIDCDTQSVCLQCTVDKFFNGTDCKLCTSTMTKCLECDVSNVCQKCDTGTFLNTNSLCSTCASAMTGCATCSSSSICTGCDSNHILVTSSCQSCSSFISNCLNCTSAYPPTIRCTQCSVGYYVDPTTFLCKPCDTSIDQCKQCMSEFQCTTCFSLYYLQSPLQCSVCQKSLSNCLNCSNDGGTCYQCIDDHSLLYNAKCQLCDYWIDDCVRCADQQHCLECEVKYHLDTDTTTGDVKCKFCQDSMQGCDTCSSATSCLTVINDFYFIYPGNSSIVKCIVQLANCLRCTSETVCIACQKGYFLEDDQCHLCIQAIDYCLQCQNRSICDVCEEDFQPYNPSGNCTCKEGWYVPSACTKVYGCISAHKFNISSSQSVCLLCESDEHFVYDPTKFTCYCDVGYELNKETCTQRCGDGTHFLHECDDGNVFSLDGCSSDCRVESQYVCEGLNLEKSLCYINLQPQIKYLYTIRTDGQNKGVHYFSIEPPSYLYDRVDFLELFNLSDDRITLLTSRHNRGHIQIQFAFMEGLQNEYFVPQWNLSKAFYTKKTQSTGFSTIPMSGPLKILNYGEYFDAVFLIGQVLAYLLLALMIISVFFHKMMAVELVLIYQIIYLTGCLGSQNISIYRVLTSLRPAFGIFDIIEGSRIELIFPQILRYWSIRRSLVLNYNISLIIYLTITIVYLSFSIYLLKCKISLRSYNQLSSKLQKKSNKKGNKSKLSKLKEQIQQQKASLRDTIFHVNKWTQFTYQRLFYPVAVFMFLPIVVGYAVNVIGSVKGEPLLVNKVSQVLFQVVFVVQMLLFCNETRKTFGKFKQPETKTLFRSVVDCFGKGKCLNYSGMFLFFCLFYLLMTLIGLQASLRFGIVSIFSLTVLYIIYLQLYQPYLDPYHNRVLIFFNSILLFHSVILLIDNYTKISQPILLSLILVTYVCGYIAVILSLYRMYLQNKQLSKFLSQNPSSSSPQKRNIKDTLKLNPYVYQQDPTFDLFPSTDLKIKRQLIFYRGRQKEKTLRNSNLTITSLPSPNNLLVDEKEDPETQLERIKKRLRNEVKYMQLEEGEDLFVFQE